MKAAWLASVVALLLALAHPDVDADGGLLGGASLCKAGEARYFACTTRSGKQLALCGSAGGGVQYRYGRSAAAIELVHPAAPAASASGTDEDLRFAHFSRAQTERYEVAFVREGTRYAVYDYIEGRSHTAGVQVNAVQIACRGRIDSRIHELQGKLPCDRDSALNLGSCR